jgi:hypothetical protein
MDLDIRHQAPKDRPHKRGRRAQMQHQGRSDARYWIEPASLKPLKHPVTLREEAAARKPKAKSYPKNPDFLCTNLQTPLICFHRQMSTFSVANPLSSLMSRLTLSTIATSRLLCLDLSGSRLGSSPENDGLPTVWPCAVGASCAPATLAFLKRYLP